jgi:hypothetical protein
MSTKRLGPWQPTSAEERLDRLESLATIRQLAMRYGLAVDARDVDALADLFVENVRLSRTESGRDLMRAWYVRSLSQFQDSVHFVGNHIIDFDDADNARGIVYCHDELDRRDQGRWEWGKIQYWDRYVRVDGEWYFKYRNFNRWYMVDALERPVHGAGFGPGVDNLPTGVLPQAFASWDRFWAEVEAGESAP